MMLDDLHVLAAAYALDAVDPEERALFEEHLDTCAACKQEVTEFIETVARLGSTSAELPPAGLRENVLAAVSQTRQVAPAVRPEAGRPRAPGRHAQVTDIRSRRRGWQTWVAAAAAVAAVVAGGVAWQEHRDASDAERTRQSAIDTQQQVTQVLSAPDADYQHIDAHGGGRVTIVRAPSTGKAVVLPSGLPELGDDRVYQLWVLADGKAFPRQLVTERSEIVEDVGRREGIAMTVEPAGGSKSPTSVPIVATA